MKRFLSLVLALAAVAAVSGCRPGTPAPSRSIRIAAAADLRFALEDLSAAFRREHPDVAVAVAYGSSGTFFAQLVNRAPFDLFLSADVAYPKQLADRHLTLAGSEFTYAVGRIVIWVPTASRLDVGHLGVRALADATVRHVSIANPEHAPYGRAAVSAIRTAGIYDEVRGKLVFGENVSQALQFVQSGSSDAGVVALSLALSPTVEKSGRYFEVPLDTYPRIEQGGAILQWAADADAARAFRAAMLAPEGRAILKRYGFFLPDGA